MYLAPDQNEVQIADEANRILADMVPRARLHREGPPELTLTSRRKLAEAGWFAISLPEAAGGVGMSEVESALFFREAGRQCASVDLLTQNLAVLLAADQPDIRDLLVSGERTVALLVNDSDGYRLLGADSEWAIEVGPQYARLIDIGGRPVESLPSLDPAVSMRRLLDVGSTALIELAGDKLWRQGQLAVAAMLVGISEEALTMLVEYAKIRETFGKQIGAYQAVRHPCAEMAVRIEAARCQLWFAAAAIKECRPDAFGHLDAAKHLANETAAFATDLNIQLHGGIGVTEEHDAHILLKHSLLLRRLFGTKRALLNQLLHAHLGA